MIKRSLPFIGIIWVISTTGCLRQNPDIALQAIFDDAWSFRLKENPLFATGVGVHTANDRLPLVTEEDIQRRAHYWQDILQRLDSIEQSGLN
ncbi:MAG TPA: DUF885 domain-containing protein, partial [Candidatus Marinimicrobia bacterium]|nr:DUF885 domain-containing protein [Candidatus Neomarinimicrobiota bacterium]